MPITVESHENLIENERAKSEEESSTWHRWQEMRTICEENSRLGVILEVSADLPSDEEIERWLSEPVRALVLSTDLFITNRSGFPVLTKPFQRFLFKFFKVRKKRLKLF